MTGIFRQSLGRLLWVWGMIAVGLHRPAHAALEAGDFLVADAGNDRILQVDVSTGTVIEVFSTADLTNANAGTPPLLSGEIHYDDRQAYLYFSGSGGTTRLYRGDIGFEITPLLHESDLLALQSAPEAEVRLTGKALPPSGNILTADRGVTRGSIYGTDLRRGVPSLLATEDDFLAFSVAAGFADMTDLDFASLSYDPGSGNYWLLSGAGGQNSSGEVRSVVYEIGPDGQPLAELAFSAVDTDWQQVLTRPTGGIYVLQSLAGEPSILAIDTGGFQSTVLTATEIESIFGTGIDLAPSLAIDEAGHLFLVAEDGTLFAIDPADPGGIGVVNTATLIISASDYLADTGTATTNAISFCTVPQAPVTYTVSESSNPANLVTPMSTPVIENRDYQVQEFNLIEGSERFGYWTFNGVRQSSPSGRGLIRPIVTMTEDIEAIAQFFPLGLDGDGDRLEDWWEFWMFGDRDQGPQDNIDADAFDHEEEHHFGYDATLIDTARHGGVAARVSAPVDFRENGAYRFEIRSEPFGLIAHEEGLLPVGNSITTPYLDGILSGFVFVGWTVNGVPQRNAEGVYLQQISFTPSEDAIVVGHFVLANADTEPDGILDGLERQNFDTLTYGPDDDPEGDGLTLETESRFGYSPALSEELRSGGVAARRSAPVTYVEGKSLYTVKSLPLGLIPSLSEYVDNGETRTTEYYGIDLVSGMEFAYWSINGTRLTDPSGFALRQITITIEGRADVIAHFYPPTLDSDGDSIRDVDEWHWFGTLTYDDTSDPDGDSIPLGEEARFGYAAASEETRRSGAMAARVSPPLSYNSGTGKRLEVYSEPLGLAPLTREILAAGTEVASARFSFAENYNGYRFTHWARNGMRVVDPSGMARGQAVFNISSDTELIAHFTFEGEDADADSLLDYQELRVVGDLALLTPSSDLEGDGINVGDEQQFGYSETIVDRIRTGGVGARRSVIIPVVLDIGPTGIGLTSSTIEEALPPGTLVGQFITASANPDDTFTYAFVPGAGAEDNARFTIEGNHLKSADTFDYELEKSLFIRVRVTDSRDNTFEEALVIAVVPRFFATYEEFAIANFTPAQLLDPLISGPEADPEGDGLTNLEEYVHALAVFEDDPSPVRALTYRPGTDNLPRELKLTFPWADGMTDVRFYVESSLEYEGWDSVPHSIIEQTSNDGVSQIVIRVALSPPHPNPEFFRFAIDRIVE